MLAIVPTRQRRQTARYYTTSLAGLGLFTSRVDASRALITLKNTWNVQRGAVLDALGDTPDTP